MSPDELSALLPSWQIHLRAERKAPGTIETYLKGVEPYLAWCRAGEHPPLERDSLRLWTMELLDSGRTPATAKTRMMAVRHFARWLHEEGELEANPFLSMKAPKVDMPVVPVLSDDQLRAMLRACEPPPAERQGLAALRHRRDEAIIRVMVETGMRAQECLNLTTADVDLTVGTVVVTRGKGGKGRTVAIGPQTSKALDRYLRVRRLHKLADSPTLWLGDRSRGLAYGGFYWSLGRRAELAGITDFNPHMLRHTSTDRWLRAGGSETGAMAQHGWSSPAMLQRYGKANREQRAIEEARRLNLGEL